MVCIGIVPLLMLPWVVVHLSKRSGEPRPGWLPLELHRFSAYQCLAIGGGAIRFIMFVERVIQDEFHVCPTSLLDAQ